MKSRPLDDTTHYVNQQLDRNNSNREWLDIGVIFKYLPEDRLARVVDVGCRAGKFVTSLIKLGYLEAYGVDIGVNIWHTFPHQLRQNFIRCDVHDGIRVDGKFDLITCSHMLEHSHDPVKVLNIFKSKLKDTGILYICVPLDFTVRGMSHTPHYTFFESVQDLCNFLENNGFEIIESNQTSKTHPTDIPNVMCFAKLK